MKSIESSRVTEMVASLALEANTRLRRDVLDALKAALTIEVSETGIKTLEQLIENAAVAEAEELPICQDTGIVAVYIRLGQELRVEGDLCEAVQEGVRRAYREGYFRKSVNMRPLLGPENTGDNTPASIDFELVPGESLSVTVMPKGGGSENVSALEMLPVSGGRAAVEDFVLKVAAASAGSCPPLVLGVGVGGSFATVAAVAKKALLREVDDVNPDPVLAAMEEDLLRSVNDLGIGPGGLGGRVTALAVKVEERPCHIACLPVAVSVSCHALRSASGTLSDR